MKTKKMKQLLDDEKKRIVKDLSKIMRINLNKTDKMLSSLKRSTNTKTSNRAISTNNNTDKRNGAIAKMIKDLYFISGTSSGSEEYIHMVGEDALILRSIKNDLSNSVPISNQRLNKLYNIYVKFFPTEAEKIKCEINIK